MNKHFSAFIKGAIISGLADYASMWLILSHDLPKLTEAVILTAILGGIFSWLYSKFVEKRI